MRMKCYQSLFLIVANVVVLLILAPAPLASGKRNGNSSSLVHQTKQNKQFPPAPTPALDAEQERTKKILAEIQAKFASRREHLETKTITFRETIACTSTDNTYTCTYLDRTISGYSPDSLVKTLVDEKKTLIQRFDGKDMAGLRAYIDENYPTFTFTVSNDPASSVVTAATTQTAFDGAEDFIKGLISKLTSSPLRVNLSLASTPSNAQFEIWADAVPIETITIPNKLTNFARGQYKYKVTKNGYKTIKGELNLVDRAGTKITCQFYANNVADGPDKCTLN